MPGQAQLADMLRQTLAILRHMLDRMHPGRQLGEDEGKNEEQMAQGIHGVSLIDLDEQTL